MTVDGHRSDEALTARLRRLPRPAVRWLAVGAALALAQAGAVAETLVAVVGAVLDATPGLAAGERVDGLRAAAEGLPTLLSRETIPNRGHWNGERWVGTFDLFDPVVDPVAGLVGVEYTGLSPAAAWALRVALVYGYVLAVAAWLWVGYRGYRRYYRVADWTPRDDVIDRFRGHYWGLFGLAVVAAFLVVVLFGPALSPTVAEENIYDPYSYELTYWDAEDGEVATTLVGVANENTRSVGSENVGPLSYDEYDRYHPFGTLPNGADLFTFIMYGARVSLVIGLLAVGLSTFLAASLALLSAYYRGTVDLGIVLVADAIMALPGLLVLIMLSVVLSETWIAQVYSGGLLLAVIFAATGWPGLWRAVRGPALQTASRGWVDAARSFGQRPRTIMRKHMLPYITGYLLVYGSMNLGGAIIAIAGLSYLGLGVAPPTPEWGRAIEAGQQYISTPSWHVSLIPGVLITVLVVGFNALGDGVRDAIDPQSDAEAAAGGMERGGGA